MTTYVLGAGASLHAGYPLGNDLGRKLHDWALRSKPQDDLDRMRLEILYEAYKGLSDLEEVLTDLEDCSPNSPASTFRSSERAGMRQAVQLLLSEFFNSVRRRQNSLYDLMAREKVRAEDTIITFNYDLACERSLKAVGLWEIGDGYGFQSEFTCVPNSKVNVLKLHGSTNWWGRISFQEGREGPKSLPDRPRIIYAHDLEYLSYPREMCDAPFNGESNLGIPALILLSRKKKFYFETSFGREWEDFWNYVWGRAENALPSSAEVVLIGYSMPEADKRARDLLLSRANKRAHVSLFCGDRGKTLKEEFNSHGFAFVESPEGAYFEDFVRT